MKYIVFDLEWNQPIDGKSQSDRKLPFEIIEIGAVKLDEEKNKIAEFSEIVRPQVYKELNVHIRKILNVTMKELQQGQTFPKVMNRFRKWCGEDMVFCIWGTQDLTELQRNISFYKMQALSSKPIPFLNVQKMFSEYIGTPDKVYNLESAIDEAGIEKDIPFHRAFSDAYYTAKILKLVGEEYIEKGITYDLYNLPKNESEEINDFDDNLYYFVSRGYDDRHKITGSKKLMSIKCMKCGDRPIRKSVSWFSSNSKNYYGAAVCPEHGPMKAKLRIRHHEKGLYYCEKFIEYTDKKEINLLREKKRILKEKEKVSAEQEKVNGKDTI